MIIGTGQKFAIQFAVLAFAGVSWYATGIGLSAAGMDASIALLVSFLIQTLLTVSALNIIPRRGHLGSWFKFVIMYLLCAAISVFFATNFWFQKLEADEYANSLITTNFNDVVLEANKVRGRYQALSEGFAELAMHSRQNANIEANGSGGTCPNDNNPGHGKGRFWAKRMWQNDRFQQMNTTVSRIAVKVNLLADEVARIAKSGASIVDRQQQLSSKLIELNQFYDNNNIAALKNELRGHQQAEFDGFPKDPKYCWERRCFHGSSNACGDNSLVNKIDSVINISLPDHPKITITTFNPNDYASVVKTLFKQLTSGDEEEREKTAKTILSGDYNFSLSMGFLFDTLLLMSALIFNASQRRGKYAHLTAGELKELHESLKSTLDPHPDLFQYQNLKGWEDGQVGYAADYIQEVLHLVSTPVEKGRILVMPLNAPRNKKERRIYDVLHSIYRALGDYHLLGEQRLFGKNEFSLYPRLGYSYADIASSLHKDKMDPNPEELFSFYIIQDRVYHLLDRFSSKGSESFDDHLESPMQTLTDRFASFTGLIEDSKDDRRAHEFRNSAEQCADYILENARPYSPKYGSIGDVQLVKQWRIDLYGKRESDKELMRWIRVSGSDITGMKGHVSEYIGTGFLDKLRDKVTFSFNESSWNAISQIAQGKPVQKVSDPITQEQ